MAKMIKSRSSSTKLSNTL